MEVGKLNKRITLQYPANVSDGMGGYTTTWTDSLDVWASIWPVSATETIQSMQPAMTITHRINMRYRSTVQPEWRIKFGERYFDIVSMINPEERNEWLYLLCKETT